MKRIISILSAGLALLFAASCNVKEDFTVLDPSLCTPPVVTSSIVTEDGITVNFTPAILNVKAPVYHALVMKNLDGDPVDVVLGSIEKDGVLTLTPDALSRTLMSLGYQDGDVVSLEIVVRASAQQKQTGNHVGYVESEARVSVKDFTVIEPKGSPYVNYTEESDWSLIGAMSAYGIDWDGDLNMWTDGNGNHVAAHVNLKAGDQVKFRKDLAWTVNMGGAFSTLDTEFEVKQDGDNIVIDKDGVYDLYLYLDKGTAMVTAAYDPFPDYTEASTWSVIGALSQEGIDWNGDIAMITDGTWHVALGVNLAEDDEFKFRQDAAWTVNLGGTFDSLDNEFEVTQDGANIKVGAAGSYDLYVNPDQGLAKVTAASGAKVSSKIGGDTPEPPAPAVTGWNIIGLNGDWDNDVIATQDGNVWTAYVTAAEPTEFKWRKDGAWDADFGGVFVNLGEPFEAVAGGPNIQIPAGFWKVVLNLDDNTITVSNGQVWGLIGVNGDWDHDIDMTLSDGKWVSPVTKIAGEFKIRENHAWSNDRGGVFTAVGQAFEAVAGGPNISVEEGNYVVTYDPAAETIVIDETGWGLVGTINDWGNGGPDVILKEDGNFLVAKNVALTENDEIKLRYNSDWDVNRGGRTAVGHGVKVENNGANIKPGVAGNYDIWFRPESDVLFVMEAGSDLLYWGLVGTINNWGNDGADLILYETEDGKFVFDELTVTGSDELKIRQNEDWGVNRGGAFAELGEPFAVENNGANIKVGRDAKFSVTYDPAEETVTLNGEYTGEAPSLPETMYIIGEAIGGWEWTGDYIVDMTPVNGQAGQFWAIRYLEAGKPFKFCAVKEWSGDFTGLGEDSGYTVADNNCSVAENGVYMIYVDVANKKLCIEPAKVYGIGTCFGGWNEGMETALFTAADGKLTATVGNAGELRMYAASSIATSDWWTREFIILDGNIAYRGNGGEQERVSVAAGAKVTLDFNAGIGTIE